MAEQSWSNLNIGGKKGPGYLTLNQGYNVMRIVSAPFEVKVHWEKAKNPDGSISNRKVICRGADCPLCKVGEVPQKRYQSLVIDRGDGVVKILEAGTSVFSQIRDFATDPDYGDPTTYDIKIKKSGSGRETKYSVVAVPNKIPLTEDEINAIKDAGTLSEFNQPKTVEEILSMNIISLDSLNKLSEPESEENVVDTTANAEEDPWAGL